MNNNPQGEEKANVPASKFPKYVKIITGDLWYRDCVDQVAIIVDEDDEKYYTTKELDMWIWKCDGQEVPNPLVEEKASVPVENELFSDKNLHNLFMTQADVWTDEHGWVMSRNRFIHVLQWRIKIVPAPTTESKEAAAQEDLVGKEVFYAGAFYEVAELKKFPHGTMLGIYDEPPSKHIDYLNIDNVKEVYPCNNCQGGGCYVCGGFGKMVGNNLTSAQDEALVEGLSAIGRKVAAIERGEAAAEEGEKELFTELFFSNTDKNTMTVNCPDEDSEMSIVIRDNGKKAIYGMTMWEAKEVADFILAHVKNEQESTEGETAPAAPVKEGEEAGKDWDDVLLPHSNTQNYDLETVRYVIIPLVNYLKKNYAPPAPVGEGKEGKMYTEAEAHKIWEAGAAYQRAVEAEYRGGNENERPNFREYMQSLK